jgi:hypothetical protein
MGKISISYYLNTKLKATDKNGVPAYPVYIRVLHKRVLTRINSTAVNIPVTEKEFANLYGANIKHKIITETKRTKVSAVTGRVEQIAETVTELVSYDMRKAIETERNIIISFFEFADKYISDFAINKSKTQFGDLLDFYACCEILQLLEWIKSNFISIETRLNMYRKLGKYIAEKTGFSFSTATQIITANVGLHAKSRDGKQEYISLEVETINDFRTAGILTDKEAGTFEFINLLRNYYFKKYSYPLAKKGNRAVRENRINNPYEFLTVRVWLREKQEIIKYISENATPYTKKYVAKLAEKAEKLFVDLFRKQYFEGSKAENGLQD